MNNNTANNELKKRSLTFSNNAYDFSPKHFPSHALCLRIFFQYAKNAYTKNYNLFFTHCIQRLALIKIDFNSLYNTIPIEHKI